MEGPLHGDHPTTRETEGPRERISGLSAAILRISASLDLATVLQEVVDSARTLTGARYGVIATVDDAGEVQDFVTSGFTSDEQDQLTSWPDGPRLFEHLRDRSGPLRLEDLHDHVRSLGFSPDLMPLSTVHGVTMRHRERHVGNFFLAGKEGGGELTSEDEEILALFASQAATAIANARAHRDEQRARRDLEALVDTSPVGVVVFDARTGRAVSINREARRIVESLRMPDQSPEQLLEVITCRFADGREIALDRFRLVDVLSGATMVRAEEVELSVPYGRTVTTLVNATPIRSDDGEVVSMVVTLQDLAPFKELEGMRAEFLGMVSHELRAPLTSIKGSAATVLNASRTLDPAEVRQFFRIIDEQANHMDALIRDLLDAGRIEAGTLSVAVESTEVAALVDQARNTFLSGGGRHPVLIDLPLDLPPVMADRQRIAQVLNNLFSNSRPGILRSPRPSGFRPRAKGCTSRSRCPTREPAFRRSSCPGCSGSTPARAAARVGADLAEPASASSSARGWWRRTGAASAARAAERAGARGSPSPSRWPVTRARAPLPAWPEAGPVRRARGAGPSPSWWWTTTRRRCAFCATRSPWRVTPR